MRLHLRRLVRGRPGAVPLVLVHGFTGDATTWAPLQPHLDPARPACAIDLVGHGRSPAPDDPSAYTLAAAVAAVADTLDAAGIARAHWLGYSMGGRVALRLALDHPGRVASLALVGASPGIPDPIARAERVAADHALADFVETAGLAAFVERWMANPLFATQSRLGPAFLASARAQRLRNRPHALAHTLRGMGTGVMEPLTNRLGAVRAPVLVVAGELDPKFRAIAAALAARLPDAEVAIIPGAGHAVHAEAPAALAARLRAFLQRVDPM